MTQVIEPEQKPDLDSRIRMPGVPMTLQDRCDGPGLSKGYDNRNPSCGAQAFVRVKVGETGELLFCGHHYNLYEYTFISSGYEIDDQRSRINQRPSVSNGDI